MPPAKVLHPQKLGLVVRQQLAVAIVGIGSRAVVSIPATATATPTPPPIHLFRGRHGVGRVVVLVVQVAALRASVDVQRAKVKGGARWLVDAAQVGEQLRQDLEFEGALAAAVRARWDRVRGLLVGVGADPQRLVRRVVVVRVGGAQVPICV